MKILIAVDDSRRSLEGVRYLIGHAHWYRGTLDVDLVHVQPPIPNVGRAGAVVGKEQIKRYYEEEGEAALAQAREMLDAAGIPCNTHVLVGPAAESIVRLAQRLDCDVIFIGTHGRTAAINVLMGSVAAKVLQQSDIPVLLVR